MQSKIKSYQKTRSIKKGLRALHGIHVASIVTLYEVSVKTYAVVVIIDHPYVL